VCEELPGFIADFGCDTLETLDRLGEISDALKSLGRFLSGEGPPSEPPRSVTGSLVKSLAELVLGWKAAGLVRTFREPIRTYTGMSDEQIERFFGR
jgi:hypothetical protein